MITHSLAQEISQLEANLCSALADASRILILYALHERPRNVTDLSIELNMNQPTMSRHLKILRERGLVNAMRQGVSVEYHLADERIIQALDLLRSVLRDNINYQALLVRQSMAESNE